MVPPPSWTALESSGLGRSASLSAGPRIQQVNAVAWLLPAWARANVSVAISRMICIVHTPEIVRTGKYPSADQRAQPSLRRSSVRLESFRAAEPAGVFDKRPYRGAVVDAEPRAHSQERV